VRGDFEIKKGQFGAPKEMHTCFKMNGLTTSLMFVALMNGIQKL
jgi:hypothetical protein